MARPKSSIQNLKLFQINIRLTLNEQVLLEEYAKEYGLSIVQYIRLRTLKKQLPKFRMSVIDRSLLIELSRIGNNLNQITKKVNQGDFSLNELREVLEGLDIKIHNLKQELLK